MAPQDIRSKLKRDPFQPLRLYVSDGSTYDIMEPGDAWMTMTELVVGQDYDPEAGLPRRSVYIAPNHVTRIEPLESARPPTENGST